MKKDILIFASPTVGTILIFVFTAGQSAIDIQLHDTYVVMDKFQVTVLIIGPLTFLIFLSLGLARKFNTAWTNIGFIIGLCLVTYIIFKVNEFQRGYRNEIQNNSTLELQAADKERFVNEMNKKINMTWGLFGVCIVGIGLTGFRTYKLLTPKR